MHPTVSASAAAASSIAMRLLEVALNTASEAVERAAALRVRSEDRDPHEGSLSVASTWLAPVPDGSGADVGGDRRGFHEY
jgi:hypothetical protein